MNRVVADPEWHGWITWYFFLGGVAAGAYAIASMAALFGGESARRGTRMAYYIAFPLIAVCGPLLMIDLNRPERFWHMLIQSETGRPMLKWWSPMSAGSWGLTAFGLFSGLSFVAVLAEDGRFGLGRWAPLARRLGRGVTGRIFEVLGTLTAFFLGSYTGTLLTATNQPIWADTYWLSALFLASSASTGIAAILLLNRWFLPDADAEIDHRLERLDLWAMALELVALTCMAIALGRLAGLAFGRWPGVLIPAFVVPVGLLLPAGLALRGRPIAPRLNWAALLVLIGGFALRYAIVEMPGPLLLAHR